MYTYTDLADIVKAYLQRNVNVEEAFPGTADATALDAKIDSLVLQGINNAKKKATQLHDFVENEVSCVATIPAGGSLRLNNLVDFRSGEVVDLKLLNNVDFESCPLRVMSKRAYNRKLFKAGRIDTTVVVKEASSISLLPALTTDTEVTVEGYRNMVPYKHRKVFKTDNGITLNLASGAPNGPWINGTYTTADNSLFNDCVGKDYYVNIPAATDGVHQAIRTLTSATYSGVFWSLIFYDESLNNTTITPTTSTIYKLNPSGDNTINFSNESDWLLEEGFEYMQWASIVEVNHLVQQFLPRTEGSLSPPTSSRDTAFEALLRWDADLAESHFSDNSI